MNKGRVKWFNSNKGFGYVETEDGEAAFLHFTELKSDDWEPDCDDVAYFELSDTKRGLEATEVAPEGYYQNIKEVDNGSG